MKAKSELFDKGDEEIKYPILLKNKELGYIVLATQTHYGMIVHKGRTPDRHSKSFGYYFDYDDEIDDTPEADFDDGSWEVFRGSISLENNE